MDDNFRTRLAKDFAKKAEERLPDILEDVILYGSVARGEDGNDSDIDLLAILKNDDDQNGRIQRGLSEIAYVIGLESGQNISIQSYPRDHIERFRSYSFFKNVFRDGIQIGRDPGDS